MFYRSPDYITQARGEPTENEVLKEFNFLSAVENDDDVTMGDEVDGGDQQRSARAAKVFRFVFALVLLCAFVHFCARVGVMSYLSIRIINLCR